jgi:hypothetical protein
LIDQVERIAQVQKQLRGSYVLTKLIARVTQCSWYSLSCTKPKLAERFSISGRMEAVSFRRKSRGEDAGWQLRGDAVDQTAACRAFRAPPRQRAKSLMGRGLSLFCRERP